MPKISYLLEEDIKIETNVPMPEIPKRLSALRSIFEKMQVGNSIVVECKPQNAKNHSANAGIKIVIRDLHGNSVAPSELKKVRIWRSA